MDDDGRMDIIFNLSPQDISYVSVCPKESKAQSYQGAGVRTQI